jgi:hypothetical protein
MTASCHLLSGAEFFVAIDNKGLWPVLLTLPDGNIGAAVYNHPSHGYGDGGNVELWTSSDGGRSWAFRSVISSQPEDNPLSIRMNAAIGVNSKNEIVALISGFQAGQRPPLLPPQLSISRDSGKTWERTSPPLEGLIPFGKIISAPDGGLLCAMYSAQKNAAGVKTHRSQGYLCQSSDNGGSWSVRSKVADGVNETWLLLCSNGELLAAARTDPLTTMDRTLPHGGGTAILRSKDYGLTWGAKEIISPQGQENASLIGLKSGKTVCFITSRVPGLFGVVYRISGDNGLTWGNFHTLISIPANDWHKTDCGYPSCVQTDDGKLLTAYYFGPKKPEFASETTPWHQRYHMGVCLCDEQTLIKQ